MENAEQDLKELETELRMLAKQELCRREEDAALLARLMERADAVCRARSARPWYRHRAVWGSAAAIAIFAVLPILIWSGEEETLPREAVAAGETPTPALLVDEASPAAEEAVMLAVESPQVGGDAIPAQVVDLPQVVEPMPSETASTLITAIADTSTQNKPWGAAPASVAIAAEDAPSYTLVDNGISPESAPTPCAPTEHSSAIAIYSGGADVAESGAANAIALVDEDSEEECEKAESMLGGGMSAVAVVPVPQSRMRVGEPHAKRKAVKKIKTPSVVQKLRAYMQGSIDRMQKAEK